MLTARSRWKPNRLENTFDVMSELFLTTGRIDSAMELTRFWKTVSLTTEAEYTLNIWIDTTAVTVELKREKKKK